MKFFYYFLCFFTLGSSCNLLAHPQEKDNFLSLSATSTWREFQLSPGQLVLQNKKWAWIASIILKSKEALQVKRINLQWIGDNIDKLHASLYRKRETDDTVLPIEENLVCDGTWNPSAQQLTFFLDHKIVAVNKFCLVLSFQQGTEQKLKKGHFALPHTDPFKLVALHR